MKRINIALCDDEHSDLAYTLSILKEHNANSLFSISLFSNAQELIDSNPTNLDIAILDIEMDDLNGFDASKQLLTINKPPIIIFTTKNNTYALKGYGIALRYIQKPFDKQSLFEALDAALTQIRAHRMTLKIGDTTYAVPLSDIFYIESFGHYITLHTNDNTFKYRGVMKEIFSTLPQLYFASPHKSFIVNLEKIQSASSDTIVLCDGSKIPISRGKLTEFNNRFYNFLGR